MKARERTKGMRERALRVADHNAMVVGEPCCERGAGLAMMA